MERKGRRAKRPELATARLVHACPGRARLAFREQRGNSDFFERVCDAMLALPGLREVEGRPATGSLIIRHDALLQPILDGAHMAGLFTVKIETDEPAATSVEDMASQIAGATITGLAGNSGKIRSGAAVAMLTMAALQAMRGQIMPPATTSLWYALALLGNNPAASPPADDGGDA